MLPLEDPVDRLFERATRLVVQNHCWSAIMLQEKLNIDNEYAKFLLSQMVDYGVLKNINSDSDDNIRYKCKEDIDNLICELENRDINLIWDYKKLSINISRGEFCYDTDINGIQTLKKIILEFKVKNKSNSNISIWIDEAQYYSQRFGEVDTLISGNDSIRWFGNNRIIDSKKDSFLYFKIEIKVREYYTNDFLNFNIHYFEEHDININVKFQIKNTSIWGVELISATKTLSGFRTNVSFKTIYTHIVFPDDSRLSSELFNTAMMDKRIDSDNIVYIEPSEWDKTIGMIKKLEQQKKNEMTRINHDFDLDKIKPIQSIQTQKNNRNSPTKTQTNGQTHSAIDDLNAMIGLTSIKKEVSTLRNFIITQQKRTENGLKTTPISYHCIFSGNPGTGKTTVARILSKIYQELGILKKGHLVETDRSGLVAEYVGQTAIKTNKIIDNALDGVLFIDEAYSLVSDSGNDFGSEAIATLLKRMEDDRDRLVVILAGYSDEMIDFVKSNPGLESRFRRIMTFPDYTEEECYQIFISLSKDYDYNLTEEASQAIKSVIHSNIESKDKNFGNARYIRNLFEGVIEHQANRIAIIENPTEQDLTTITKDDIKHLC